MGWYDVKDEDFVEALSAFPDGIDAVKPYLRNGLGVIITSHHDYSVPSLCEHLP